MSSFPPVPSPSSTHHLRYEVVGLQPRNGYPERFTLDLAADGHARLKYEYGPIHQTWTVRTEAVVWTRLWEALGHLPTRDVAADPARGTAHHRLEVLDGKVLHRTATWNDESAAAGVGVILDSVIAQTCGLPSTVVTNALPPLTHRVVREGGSERPEQEAAAVFGMVGGQSAFALARAGGGFAVFSTDPLKLLGETAEDGQSIRALALGSDGERDLLLTGGDDGAVWAWDLTGDDGLRHARGGHGGAVRAVAARAEGDSDGLVYSGGEDGNIWAWGDQDAAEVGALTGHHQTVNALDTAQVSGLSLLVSGGDDGTVRIWNTDTGEVLRTLAPGFEWVNAVAITGTQNRGLVAAAGDDHVVRMWDITTGAPTQALHGHTAAVTGLAFLDLVDGAVLASCSYDGTIRTWDSATGQALNTWHAQDVWPAALAAGPSTRGAVLLSGGETGSVRIWNGQGTLHHTLAADGGPVQALALAAHEGTAVAATGYLDGTVRTWDVATSTMRHLLAPDDGAITSVAFGPEGATVVCGTACGTVRIHATADGTLRLVPTPHTDRISCLVFLPLTEGKAASAGADRTVRTWETATGRPLLRLLGHEETVTHLAAGHVGPRTALASADANGTVLVWDAISGQRLNALRVARPLTALTMGTVEGRAVLAAAERRGLIRVWDLPSGEERATLDIATTAVATLAISTFAGTTALLVGTQDNTVQAWQLPNGAAMGTLSIEQTPLALSFTPPGTLHAAGSGGLTTIHPFPS